MKILLYMPYWLVITCLAANYGTAQSRHEYIDNVKLNGKIGFTDNYMHVKSVLGKPDSIAILKDASVTYFDKGAKFAYFKGIVFEKWRDKMVMSQIDFRKSPKAWVQCGKIRLSNQTSIAVIRKYFPKAAVDELRGTDMDKRMVIGLNTGKKPSDDQWLLFLDRKTGRLYRIDYWMPD